MVRKDERGAMNDERAMNDDKGKQVVFAREGTFACKNGVW